MAQSTTDPTATATRQKATLAVDVLAAHLACALVRIEALEDDNRALKALFIDAPPAVDADTLGYELGRRRHARRIDGGAILRALRR